jgi:hypothetical protein
VVVQENNTTHTGALKPALYQTFALSGLHLAASSDSLRILLGRLVVLNDDLGKPVTLARVCNTLLPDHGQNRLDMDDLVSIVGRPILQTLV